MKYFAEWIVFPTLQKKSDVGQNVNKSKDKVDKMSFLQSSSSTIFKHKSFLDRDTAKFSASPAQYMPLL